MTLTFKHYLDGGQLFQCDCTHTHTHTHTHTQVGSKYQRCHRTVRGYQVTELLAVRMTAAGWVKIQYGYILSNMFGLKYNIGQYVWVKIQYWAICLGHANGVGNQSSSS